jgi:hypothetical protein
VATKQNIVAIMGWIIPVPLAMPPIVTGRPPISTRQRRFLGVGVGGHDALGAPRGSLGRERLHQLGQSRADLVHRQVGAR